MKTLEPKVSSQKLSDAIQLARLRLAKAKERAHLARQRRKTAKLAARQAKKRLKSAKEQVVEAKLALAEVEAKLAQLQQAPVKPKPRRKLTKKVAVVPRQKKTVPTVVARSPEIVKAKKPVARRTKARSKVTSIHTAVVPPAIVPNELESPVAVIPALDSKATAQIVKGVEEIFTAENPAETFADPGAAENVSPTAESAVTPNQAVTNN